MDIYFEVVLHFLFISQEGKLNSTKKKNNCEIFLSL